MLDFESCLEQIWEQLIAAPPSRGRSMTTVKIGSARILMSSWEVTAFVSEDGPSAEDLRRAVVARALVTAATEAAKQTGNATDLDRALSVARIEVSRLQERVDVAKQAKDTEAAVNLGNNLGSGSLLPNFTVLILTDETEFARLLTACWQAERQPPAITVLAGNLWKDHPKTQHDLIVVGPLRDATASEILAALDPSAAAILCGAAEPRELNSLRARYPRLIHIPLREDWTQTLLLVATEALRRIEALRIARHAEFNAARNENHATLGQAGEN